MGVQTNNVGELEAILRVLVAVPADQPVLVLTDSQYAVNACTSWWRGWRRNGWKARNGEPVKNRERIELIVDVVAFRRAETRIEWVRGHAGHPLNSQADAAAVRAREMSPQAVALFGPGWGTKTRAGAGGWVSW